MKNKKSVPRYEFVQATAEHCKYIAEHLKGDNRREMMARTGADFLGELLASLKESEECSACLVDGRAMAVFGVERRIDVLDSIRCVWLIMSAEAEQHKVFIGKQTKRVLYAYLRRYPRLFNWVDAGNEDIIRWLKWLGADLAGPTENGVYGFSHYYFEFRAEKLLKEE